MVMSFLRGLATLMLTLGLVMMVMQGPARAQDPTERVWIQVESYAALGAADARIRSYTPEFDNVNGFNAGSFYAITLGPYVRAEAERVLQEFLTEGRIPSDSFIQPPTSARAAAKLSWVRFARSECAMVSANTSSAALPKLS